MAVYYIAIGEHIMLLAPASKAGESFLPASICKIVLTGHFGAIRLDKLGDRNVLELLSCNDLPISSGFSLFCNKKRTIVQISRLSKMDNQINIHISLSNNFSKIQ